MHYPPEHQTLTARHAFTETQKAMNTNIRWTVDTDGGFESGSIPADMLGLEHDPDPDEGDREWTIDVRIPAPIDVTLDDWDDRQRAYEVMQALAEGKTVTIEGEDA